jgi:uncharacterized protein YjbI with pentapeptide repeats
MADEEQLKIIRKGVDAWNGWREKNPEVQPDLSEAPLSGANLREADLNGADLIEANLWRASLSWANLWEANLSRASLSGANISGADLGAAQLIETDLRGASLPGSSIYGVSVWNIKVDDQTNQQNLRITPPFGCEPTITVDNIKVAQFIYLLLNNDEIRDVIDTITSKAVLILGRFSEDRKPVLNAIRNELRNHDYLPIMFDFDPTTNQTISETVKTLAGMSRFVIADITDARSVLQELEAIVPDLPSLAVRLMIKKSAHEYGMLGKIRKYPWIIGDTYQYENAEELIASIQENIIGPAEEKVKELRSQG